MTEQEKSVASSVEVEAAVDFTPLWGEPIEAVLMGLEQSDEDDVFAEVVMSGAMFARVIATEAFAFLDEALDAGEATQLDPAQGVRLELRLRPGVHVFIARTEEEVPLAIARALIESNALSALVRNTEAWLLCSAMQDIEVPDAPEAEASIGIRTAWAR